MRAVLRQPRGKGRSKCEFCSWARRISPPSAWRLCMPLGTRSAACTPGGISRWAVNRCLTAPPVKQVALAHGTPVFQPRTLRGGAEDDTIRALAPEIIVVVAYGCILPASVLQIRPMAASTCTFRCCRLPGQRTGAVVGAERRCRDRRLHYADGRGAGHRRGAQL